MRFLGGQPEQVAGSAKDLTGQLQANIPEPDSERGAWMLAVTLGALGVLVLALVLSGVVGSVASRTSGAAPPSVLAVTPTPVPSTSDPVSNLTALRTDPPVAGSLSGGSALDPRLGARAIVGDLSAAQSQRDLAVYEAQTSTHIGERWMQGFYPIYTVAQQTFGVNWLLIASVHKQESAFSTAPSTYRGLNFAGCCGGPMQFNVTNGGAGIPSTWALVNNSYRYGERPASYDHMTDKHPSIYDDFDSVMAAAHLLSADGAASALDGSAWGAAYDYYGHDATGVTYADQVLARAIGWSQHGFCINCGVEQAMVEAVHAAYGASVAASLQPATAASVKHSHNRHH